MVGRPHREPKSRNHVKLALNHRGQLVRADAVGPYSFGLRCPCCKEPVFARLGSVREAHFAHRSGNANRDCELYYPGSGGDWHQGEVVAVPPRTFARERLGAPALLWRCEEGLAASLYLRLPTHPEGFGSRVRITSFTTSQHRGGDLTAPVFVRLRLQIPPGQVHTSPMDESLEKALIETLAQFRLTGNYFKATGEGGVLVPLDQPLELRETYWLLTQSQLDKSAPGFVRIEEHRTDRAWHAYRIVLACDPEFAEDSSAEIARYLGRDVINPRPTARIIWPLPIRRDADGIKVFSNNVKELLIRSPFGPPHARLRSAADVTGSQVDRDLYSLNVLTTEREALVGLPNGRWERIRFDACELNLPESVWLSNQRGRAALFDPGVENLIARGLPLRVEVPAHRMWRNISINGSPIRPIPDGLFCEIQGPLSEIDAGTFGSVRLAKGEKARTSSNAWWAAASESLVKTIGGERAVAKLRLVSSQAMLLRWAQEYRAIKLLPRLMFEFSRGTRQ